MAVYKNTRGLAISWRAGEAANMQKEFERYRLSGWLMTGVGMFKVALLIAGVIFPV